MDINYGIFMVRLLQNPKQYQLITNDNFITEVEVEFFSDLPDSSKELSKSNSMLLKAWDQLGNILYHFRENDFLIVEGELAIQKLAKNEECIIQIEK